MLLKCPKSRIGEHLWTVNMLKCPKHGINLHCTSVFFSYFLITLKVNQLQKLRFSSIWNFETVCYHVDSQWQVFCLCKSECLTKPLQMQLSPNQKIFSDSFLNFRNLHKTWNTLKKKRGAWEVICFWNYKLQKAGLLKCPKRHGSENLCTVKILKCLKHCINLQRSIFFIFFDHSEKESAWKTRF